MDKKDESDGRRGIQSVEAGGRLLVALTRHGEPMMLRDLAAAAGLSPASAHPYLVSFGRLGLVEREADGNRYRLGAMALQMGLASLRQLDPLRLAQPRAAELSATTGLSVAISVWANFGATVVSYEPSRRPLHVALRPGSVMSLSSTATGRLWAALLPRERWEHLEDLGALAVGGEVRGPTRAALKRLVDDIRRKGYSATASMPTPGVNAYAAPVFEHDGSLVLSLTLIGTESDLPADDDGPAVRALREEAAGLSARLGWTGPRVAA